MKSKTPFIIVFLITSLVLVGMMVFFYQTSEPFRDLFSGVKALSLKPQGTAAASSGSGSSGLISFGMLLFTLILQIFAFLAAVFIYRDIRKSKEEDRIRLVRVDNAELFLDLPLYFGLFGTVLSFTVMTFNPSISRLIAYSSTLIGIIISVLLRVVCQYPMRQALLTAIAEKEGVRK